MGWQDAPLAKKSSWSEAPLVQPQPPAIPEQPQAPEQVNDSLLAEVNGKPPLATTVFHRAVDRYLKPDEPTKSLVATTLEPGGVDTLGKALVLGQGDRVKAGAQAVYQNLTQGKSGTGNYKANMGEIGGKIKGFEEKNPGAASTLTLAGNVLGGGLASSALKSGSWLTQLGYNTVEGMLVGEGNAPEKDKKGGAVQGAAAGLVGGALGTSLEKLIGTVIPGSWKAGKKLFTGAEDALGPDATREQAMLYLGNYLQQTGDTPAVIAKKLRSLDRTGPNKNRTLADVMEHGAPLTQSVAKHSDESRDIARASKLNRGEKDLDLQLKEDLGAGTKNLQANNKFEQGLTNTKKAIGTEIEDYTALTPGKSVDNPELIDDFWENKIVKSIEKDVNPSLQLRGKGPHYDGGTPGTDTNKQVYDAAYVQRVSSQFGEKLKSAKENSLPTADLMEAKRQWEDIADTVIKDPKLRELRTKYGVAAANERAYASGATDFSKLKESDVLKTVEKFSSTELDAYREGVITHIANKEKGPLAFLTDGTMRKMTPVFGPKGAADMRGTLAEALMKQKVSKATAVGIGSQIAQVADRTLDGQLAAAKDIMGRLRNKRAYGWQGGIFMVGNEVVDVMLHSSLSKPVVTDVMKALATSGDDVPKLLQTLAEVEMPKLTKMEMLKRASSAASKARSGGYSTGAASVIGNVTGAKDD